MKYLILFDIDGTILLMKSRISRLVFADMLKKLFGKDVPLSAMPDFAGMTDLQILKSIAKNISLDYDEINDSLERIWMSLSHDFSTFCTADYINLMPGIIEFLAKLDDNPAFQLGLLTGNFREHAYLKLKAHNLDHYFPFGAFGCDNEDRNLLPPIAIRRANDYAGENLYNERNTVIIGDTPRDIECAKVNHIPVIAVATGSFNKKDLISFEPDLLLKDFSDTNEAMDSIFKLLNIPSAIA